MIGRLRPYRLHLALLTYTPIILVADSRIGSIWEQVGLGVMTAVVLWLCTRSLPPHERWLSQLMAPLEGDQALGAVCGGVTVVRRDVLARICYADCYVSLSLLCCTD